jgi:hypothetical protein
MGKYKQMEARMDELEAEFNSVVIDSGRKHLLFEYFDLRMELDRLDAINRRLFHFIGFMLHFALGFMLCFTVFVEVFDMLIAAQKFP